MNRAALWALPALLSCQQKADADAVAASCGSGCPAGTYVDEVRESRSDDVASADFVEGSCEWSCVAVAACPDGTVPVITADCFTCAQAMPDDTVAGADCDPEDWFAGRDDAADGRETPGEMGGSATRDEDITYTGAVVVDVLRPSFQPRALATGAGGMWAYDLLEDAIHRLDPTSGAIIDSLPAEYVRPDALAVGDAHLWALDGDEVHMWTLADGEYHYSWWGLGTVTATTIAADDDALLLIEGTEVTRIDPETTRTLDIVGLDATVPANPTTWADGRLITATAVDAGDPPSWTFAVLDGREVEPWPVAATFSVEIGAAPVDGLGVLDGRLYAVGLSEGEHINQIVVLELE